MATYSLFLNFPKESSKERISAYTYAQHQSTPLQSTTSFKAILCKPPLNSWSSICSQLQSSLLTITTKNLPSNLYPLLLKFFQTADSSFSDIISNLKPDLLIYDCFQPWSAKQAQSQGIPAVLFRILGAASILSRPEAKNADGFLKFLSDNVFFGEMPFVMNQELSSDIILQKTSKGFEGKYIEHLSKVSNKKIVPVGPLVDGNTSDGDDPEMIISWLNGKKQHSTVYISFGSEHFLSEEEMGEMAKGLEICGVNFIWVVRFPAGEKVSTKDALPEGFIDRVKERGLIVEGWAPQAKILAHPSVGGFMSHCGWSSINESLYFGVPIICMPFKLLMLVDAKLLIEEGVGVEVARDESQVYKGEEVAKAIKKTVLEESGEAIRRKAREVGDKMRMEEEQELDEAAEELWQLCLKKNSAAS